MTLTMKKCWPGAINAYAQGAGGVAGGMVVGKGTWGFGRDAGGVRQQRGKGVCVCVCARVIARDAMLRCVCVRASGFWGWGCVCVVNV